jgi:hypothetical protein
LLIALAAGIFGISLSILFASFAFLLFSLPNLSLAAFFSYKYLTYNKTLGKSTDRRRGKKI